MKKIKYYGAYIPLVGIWLTLIQEESCIYDSEVHHALSALTQAISIGLALTLLGILI